MRATTTTLERKLARQDFVWEYIASGEHVVYNVADVGTV